MSRPRMLTGYDLDRIADNRPPSVWIFVGTLRPWTAADEAGPICPGCGTTLDEELRPASRYCLRCDKAGLDGRCDYPGLDVGAAMDPNYAGAGTSYRPDPRGLKGGVS